MKSLIKVNKSFVDSSKVMDHHAIIPTEQKVNLSALNEKERKVCNLAVKRFFSVMFPPFEYEQTTIKTRIGEESFIAKGKMVIASGWKEVNENHFDDEELQIMI